MTVYIDDMYAPFRRMKMCHMIASTTKELLEMADSIGVKRRWIQHAGTPEEHFDVCMSARRSAVTAGAVEVTLLDLATMTYSRRKDGMLTAPPLCRLPGSLKDEAGMLGSGVAIWRRGEECTMWHATVGEFLDRPDTQGGTWLIDGGWGGPPGPLEVDWIDGVWINQGFLGERRGR